MVSLVKYSPIQRENVKRGRVASIIATSFQNCVALHSHKPKNIISICQMPHHRLSAIRQTRLYNALSCSPMFQKSLTVIFYPSVANSFTNLLAQKSLNSYNFFKIKYDSARRDLFTCIVSHRWLSLN